jgi:NAD-dependent dihydropyrimidine dehydrogenase PreA subunit
MKIFFFTATGNSLYVAKKIGGELYSIPNMLKEGQVEFEDEAIGFVFPCYGFGLPRMVIEFLQKSKFTAEYFFAVMTYGNKAAAGLRHLEKVGSKAGIQFNYTNEILMIDNFLPAFKMEDQLAKESSKKIEENLAEIVRNIQERQNKLLTKGWASVILSKALYNIFSKIQVDSCDKWLIVQDSCNRCKVCMKVCPKNNIKVGIKAEFLHHCDGCHACIHHCPQNAIHLKFERSKARFTNRNVEIKEIIAANNHCDV